MSQAITYTEARQNLAETMNRVCDHHEPVIITRQKSPSVVLMSLEDYNAIMDYVQAGCEQLGIETRPMPPGCGIHCTPLTRARRYSMTLRINVED